MTKGRQFLIASPDGPQMSLQYELNNITKNKPKYKTMSTAVLEGSIVNVLRDGGIESRRLKFKVPPLCSVSM